MIKFKDIENLWGLGIFLGVLGLISALILSYADELTAKPIKQAEAAQQQKALTQVLPPFDNEPAADGVEVDSGDGKKIKFYRAFKDGKLVGVAAQVADPNGYAGEIEGLVGILPDGSVRSVLVTKNNETPGLGSEVCARKVQKTIFTIFKSEPEKADAMPPNPILDQFAGKTLATGSWQTSKDGGEFAYVTGATVTSRALVRLTAKALTSFEAGKNSILETK